MFELILEQANTMARANIARRTEQAGAGGTEQAVPYPGLKNPAGTGPITAVTGLTGPDRFRHQAVRNRPKFKI